MNQLIQRLDQDLAVATDRQVRAELFARKACCLARMGKFESATQLVGELRASFGDWSSGRTHVWIMIAEGLLNWYSDLSPLALDRITRAQVLSVAMRYNTGIAISSAWKAHLEFEMSNFDSMFRSLELASKSSDAGNNDANSRIAIVMCNVFSCCGNWAGAQEWFRRGRVCALAEGDQAGIEALQYNRAALAITWIRAECFDGRIDADAMKAARRELESARNYQLLAQLGTLTNHLALCDARLLAMEGHFLEAAGKLKALRADAPFAKYHFNNNLIDVEVAYCQFKSGNFDAALTALRSTSLDDLFELDVDDRFVLVCMLLEMSQFGSEFGDPDKLVDARSELRDMYWNSRASLQTGVDRFLVEVAR